MSVESSGINVFAGPQGMADFLNPNRHLPTPLVELDASLNRLISEKVKIFAKLQFLSPLLTGKWNVAYNMLSEAYTRGRLQDVVRLVENSSGGTAFALKVVAKVVFGIDHLDAIVPRDMAPSKLEGLRLLGVNYRFSDEVGAGVSGTEAARREGAKSGSFCGDQYGNDDNWRAHERWLAQQIWSQLDGKLTHYYGPLGTGGHVIGPKMFFEKIGAGVRVRGVNPTKDQVPGARSIERIRADVRFGENSDLGFEEIEIDPEDAFKTSLEMWRRGILAGPSGGMTLAGALRDLEATRDSWPDMRNKDGDIVAVVACVDVSIQYAEKYTTHLSAEDLIST